MSTTTKLFKSREQRDAVWALTCAMIDITRKSGYPISKETLALAAGRYCSILDPVEESGQFDKYRDQEDASE